jgi:magnesium-transporting ATPase (P-type)
MTEKIVPKRAAFRRAGIQRPRAGAYSHAEPGQRSGSCRGAGASAKNRAERAAGEKGKPAWLRFLAHFNDVLIYVLLAAAVLTAVMGHWVDTLVILGVAVINALIGHIQESNAEKSLKSIRNMLSSEARVIRNGNHETIPQLK